MKRESEDKSAVAVLKTEPQLVLRLARLRTIRISEGNEVSGKPDAKSFGINFVEYDSHSVRYVKQVSALAWTNLSQNSSSAKYQSH